MVGITLGLTMESGPAWKTEALAGVSLTAAPVDTGALLGTVGAPIAFGAPVGLTPGPCEARSAGTDIGFDTDPVIAGFLTN